MLDGEFEYLVTLVASPETISEDPGCLASADYRFCKKLMIFLGESLVYLEDIKSFDVSLKVLDLRWPGQADIVIIEKGGRPSSVCTYQGDITIKQYVNNNRPNLALKTVFQKEIGGMIAVCRGRWEKDMRFEDIDNDPSLEIIFTTKIYLTQEIDDELVIDEAFLKEQYGLIDNEEEIYKWNEDEKTFVKMDKN